MKLPHGYREASFEERPGFNRTDTCIIVRVYDAEGGGKVQEKTCGGSQAPNTGGLCEWHAARFLKADELVVRSRADEAEAEVAA